MCLFLANKIVSFPIVGVIRYANTYKVCEVIEKRNTFNAQGYLIVIQLNVTTYLLDINQSTVMESHLCQKSNR
jgi:hypothetical protein